MKIKVFPNYFLLIIFLLFVIFLSGIWYFLFDIDIQKCEMTYMFDYPAYKQYHIPEIENNKSINKYGLYHYREGANFEVIRGIPVLFIPGNCGSFKQVRSLASVSRQISISNYPHQMFDYFAVDLNEELSCASGHILRNQIEFVIISIKKIRTIYKENVKKIIIIGHSMGGFIARASLMNPEIGDFVSLIIGLAAPLELPVAGLDPDLIKLYNTVNEFWSNQRNQLDIPIISVTGGNRDMLVWDGYGRMKLTKLSIWTPVISIPKVGVSADHLCIAWCRQLMLTLNRALYSNINQNKLFQTSSDIILHSFKSQLNPNVSYVNSKRVHFQSYFQLLLYSTPISFEIGDDNSFQLPGLSHVTRPLRLQINYMGCEVKETTISLILPKIGHSYQRQVSTGGSVLLSLSAKPEFDESVILKPHGIPGCPYDILIDASIIDWTATLIRIHFGRFPALISAALILQLFDTGLFGFVTFSGLSCLGLHTISGLGQLYESGLIDVYDVLLLIGFSLPLAKIVYWLNFSVFRILAYLVRLILLFTPSFVFYFIPTAIVVIFGSSAPVVASFCLWLCFFFTVAFQTKHYEITSHDCGISVILFVITLINLPPSFAQWHSIMKHGGIREVFLEWISEVTDLSTYQMPYSCFILLVVVLLRTVKRKRELTRKFKPLLTIYWLISVVIASGCVIQGSVDIFKCVPFLITAIIVIESTNFINIKK